MTQIVDMPFFVLEQAEFRIGRSLIARFLPGMSYRLTNKNKEFVAQMIEDGKAQYGTPRAATAALAGQMTGRVNTAKKKA